MIKELELIFELFIRKLILFQTVLHVVQNTTRYDRKRQCKI